MPAAAPAAALDLATRFPDIDLQTICETLALCDNDAEKCADTLTQVLAEEAAEEPPSMLRTLFDSVSLLAELPRAQQPEDLRERVHMLCACLEVNGIRLLQPVAKMLDGIREPSTLVAGLDESDRVVTLLLLDLVTAASGEAADREAVTSQCAGESEFAEARQLERHLDERKAVLAQKAKELKALKVEVVKHRLAASQSG